MQEHFFHSLLISVGLGAGLLVWFWDAIQQRRHHSVKFKNPKFRSTTLLLFLFFFIFHASPVSLVIAHHHQAQDQSNYHPCCMPQVGTTVLSFEIKQPTLIPHEVINQSFDVPYLSVASPTNNRSPPFI